jgi:N-acyl-D-amino-acid deacylase
MTADLVVRGGTVVDGTGRAPRQADVAVAGDRVVAVGEDVGPGRREIDATGLLITPGFVDPHTHYDGQATWDPFLAPSSHHGVTTVAMGNCGVGFAPVEPDRHDWLIAMMEGVEDIPGTALHEGLKWDWKSFPEYLDALDRQRRTIDVGTHFPHAALRAFVMGERGADPNIHPDADELHEMSDLLGAGLDAGAIGVSTSRTEMHRTSAGENLGTLRTRSPELSALATVLRDRGTGVFQFISDCYRTTSDSFAQSEFELISEFARTSRRPVSYSVQQDLGAPERWRDLIRLATDLRAEGLDVKTQVAPRPIGVLFGLQASANVFTPARAYKKIADLPLPERIEALRDPDRRRKIIDGHRALTTGPDAFQGYRFFARFDQMFVLGDPVDYDFDSSRSLAVMAQQAGVDPREYAYDIQLQRDGRQLIYNPIFNFAHGNLDAVREMITSPASMFGLSDAGAHCGQICDGSMTTTYLSMWARDRRERDGLPIEAVVRQITSRPAEHLGWMDRGVVKPGYLADLNIIDLDQLGCAPPEIVADLPAGGQRLLQESKGYRWTIKRGTITFEDGVPTGELPGVLVRGAQLSPN